MRITILGHPQWRTLWPPKDMGCSQKYVFLSQDAQPNQTNDRLVWTLPALPTYAACRASHQQSCPLPNATCFNGSVPGKRSPLPSNGASNGTAVKTLRRHSPCAHRLVVQDVLLPYLSQDRSSSKNTPHCLLLQKKVSYVKKHLGTSMTRLYLPLHTLPQIFPGKGNNCLELNLCKEALAKI